MPSSGHPTLLVFTLGAVRESARRALLPEGLRGMEVDLRQGCLAAALEAGRACGCRLEVCSPSPLPLPAGVQHVPQAGAGFGSRLALAVAGALERGAAPLLVVGTDVPGLAARHLEEALALLGEDPDRVVLGPSPDGGLYLIAASRPIPGLDAVRWCRRGTLREVVRILRAAGRSVLLLEPLSDLDRPADLEAWLAAARPARGPDLVGRLRRALAQRRRPAAPAHLGALRPACSRASSGRSPPAALPG
jgi:hypothetical protein